MSKKLEEMFAELSSTVKLDWAYSELFDRLPGEDSARVKMVTVVLAFAERGFGFGEITIKQDETGKVYLNTEGMGKDGVAYFLAKLLDGAVDDLDRDPEHHRKYCEVMKQTCGPACFGCGTSETLR